MYDLMAVPLFHSGLPVIPSSAYNTAGVPVPPAAAGFPDETANTTLFTITGGTGELSVGDVQPGCRVSLPPSSAIFQATTELFVAASSHARPGIIGTAGAPPPPRPKAGGGAAAAAGSTGAGEYSCQKESASPVNVAPGVVNAGVADETVIVFASRSRIC